MWDYFHLYICTSCSYCKEAMDLLEKEERDFIVTVMDKCTRFRQGISTQLNFPTVPIVMGCNLDGKVQIIGGYTQLKSHLEQPKEVK